jgi:hypothetical protein
VAREAVRNRYGEEKAVEGRGDAERRWTDPHACGSAGRTARGRNHGGGVALTRFQGVEIFVSYLKLRRLGS